MTPGPDAAGPDLYTALNAEADLRPSGRVVLEHFMGALLERPHLEAAAESYLSRYGPEALAEVVVASPLEWALAYFDSPQ